MALSILIILSGLSVVLNVDKISVTAERSSQVKFFCIHSADTNYKETSMNDRSMLQNLDFGLDFAFFVHGWQSEFSVEKEDNTPYKIGLEWVKTTKTNFCGVDWKELASDGYYDAAIKHVKTVGKQLAAFIIALEQLNGKVDAISIAGHSLGAHVAGYAGKTIDDLNKPKISTIFGLDPAGPFFTLSILLIRSDFCLSQNDANFVQVLHTTSTLGTSKNIGHADFIANGGHQQNACLDEVLTVKDELIKCSHSHAKDIFLSSFEYSCSGYIKKKSEGFLSRLKSFFSLDKSADTDVYGIHSKRMSGVFELDTSNSSPYCKKVRTFE